MSLVLSTVLIALFVVMPGAFLDHFVSSGKMSRARAPTPVVTDVAIYVALSIPVHLATIAVLQVAGAFRSQQINFELFARLIAGEFGERGADLTALGDLLAGDRAAIAAYLASTAVVALLLGWSIQYILLRVPRLGRLLPFRNHWFNTFFLPGWRRVTACRAFVLTTTEAWGGPLLYSGVVEDFRADATGELTELRLKNPLRSPLTNRPGVEAGPSRGERVWTPLDQELLILRGTDVRNISVSYQRAWQPLAILARQTVIMKSGDKVVVDLARDRRWRHRVWRVFGPPNAVHVKVKSTDYGITAEEVREDKVHITLHRVAGGAVPVEVIGLRRTILDGMSENTGNLFFWAERMLLRLLTRWVERRVTVWGTDP